jgi:cytochrome b
LNKSYIWSFPTRVFHIVFALLITICLLTDDDTLRIHITAGYLLLLPLTFRAGWGIFGPKYSLFKHFPLSLEKAKEFMLNIFDKEQKYIGHNPAASFIMITMLFAVPIIIFTGTLALGAQEAKGIFATLGKDKFYKELHEVFANIMYVLIFAHSAGIAVDRLLHKEHGNLQSIASGYKNTQEKESIKTNIFQKLFFAIFAIAFFVFAIYLIFDGNNPLIS